MKEACSGCWFGAGDGQELFLQSEEVDLSWVPLSFSTHTRRDTQTSSKAALEEDLRVRGPRSNKTVPPPTSTRSELSHPPRLFEPSTRVILVVGYFRARW